jgi:hypothetical protein
MTTRVTDTVTVEYFTFALADAEVPAAVPWPAPVDEEAGDGTVTANANRIDFRSVGEFHRAVVEMSAWDGPPPPPEGDWDDEHEVTFESGSGQVRLCAVVAGCSPTIVRIGPPRHIYGLWVYCTGRDRTLLANLEGKIPDGSERYDLRFWPIRPVDDE